MRRERTDNHIRDRREIQSATTRSPLWRLTGLAVLIAAVPLQIVVGSHLLLPAAIIAGAVAIASARADVIALARRRSGPHRRR